jgi:hypothetical protein
MVRQIEAQIPLCKDRLRLLGMNLMMLSREKAVVPIITALTALFLAGCGGPSAEQPGDPEGLGTTIGSLVQVAQTGAVALEGYGLVGGLTGTGSIMAPPDVTAYLERYIKAQMHDSGLDIEKLMRSRDTAVVRLRATLPEGASKNQEFDVRVAALTGTRTTSLENGWLYTADLRPVGALSVATATVAKAGGPVYIDKLGPGRVDKRAGYVLAGADVLKDYSVSLILSEPDFQTAGDIRNRINERFGPDVATAVTANQVELKVPHQYRKQRQRFLSVVQAMYLQQDPALTARRIEAHIKELAAAADKAAAEVALEAIGHESLRALPVLLNSSNEEVRARAGRCMLRLDSDRGLQVLRRIAGDATSSYRVQALEAIALMAKREDAAATARRLLRDDDFQMALAAYEQLRRLNDVAVAQTLVGRRFYLEQIAQTPHKAIFVARRGQPRIVLFGAPLYCRDEVFVESSDGGIMINSPAGQNYVSVMRKHPQRPTLVGPLRTSFNLSDIIQVLCDEPLKERGERGGLGVSYADMVALLQQMSAKGAVEAQFRAGPLPEIR